MSSETPVQASPSSPRPVLHRRGLSELLGSCFQLRCVGPDLGCGGGDGGGGGGGEGEGEVGENVSRYL